MKTGKTAGPDVRNASYVTRMPKTDKTFSEIVQPPFGYPFDSNRAMSVVPRIPVIAQYRFNLL